LTKTRLSDNMMSL